MTWKALTDRCFGHVKEGKTACHETLVHTKIEPGQDPHDFLFVLDECGDRHEEMQQSVHNGRYEDR